MYGSVGFIYMGEKAGYCKLFSSEKRQGSVLQTTQLPQVTLNKNEVDAILLDHQYQTLDSR